MSAGVNSRIILLGSSRAPGGIFYGLNGQTITGDTNGAWGIVANGTNQNITLTPSGTGVARISSAGGAQATLSIFQTGIVDWQWRNVATSGHLDLFKDSSQILRFAQATGNLLLGTTTDSANGRLQLTSHTTSAGGIGFGADTALYRSAAGILSLAPASGPSQFTLLGTNGFLTAQGSLVLQANNGTTVLTLDTSSNTTLAGQLRITNPTTPASASATGTIGTIAWDTSYFYICTATNTWRRAAHVTW